MITVSREVLVDVDEIVTTYAALEASLAPELKPIAATLRLKLCPPPDIPGCPRVIAMATQSIRYYRNGLGETAAPRLIDLIAKLEQFERNVAALNYLPWSASALMDRLQTYPVWGCLSILATEDAPDDVVAAVGAELAMAIAGDRAFKDGFANNLRRAIGRGEDFRRQDLVVVKQVKSALKKADKLFKKFDPKTQVSVTVSLELQLRQWYRARIKFANNRSEQAVFHLRTQSKQQFLASAKSLKTRCEAGEDLPILMCIGGLLGLRADLVGQIPVLTASISDDWLVAIDVQNGTLHWSLDQIIKDGAKPSVGVDAKSVVPASRIVVTPLPQFLAHVLRTRLASIPEAKRLGDLLSGYRLLTSHTLTTDEDRQLAPSYARFVNTIGSFAVNAGINRYCAAVITHDPRLVPTGKFHYALAQRTELWSASEDLFKAMGWGTPVAFVPGLAAGSRVVPDDRSIRSLHAWMSNQLATASEGDMRDFKLLTAYSNCFVECVASMLAWALMLRERKVIPIFADAAFGDQACLSLGDKRVGLIKEPHSISICSLVRDLLTSLFQHYQWLEVMLNDCEQECAVILDGVRAILDGKHVPVLALIRRRRLVSLSSKDLEKWWPINLGIKDNGGRHHMPNALRDRHVADTLIDHYARHNNRGRGILSSTSMMSLRKLRAVCDSVDQIAGDLGLAAFPNKFSAGKEGV